MFIDTNYPINYLSVFIFNQVSDKIEVGSLNGTSIFFDIVWKIFIEIN